MMNFKKAFSVMMLMTASGAGFASAASLQEIDRELDGCGPCASSDPCACCATEEEKQACKNLHPQDLQFSSDSEISN